MHVKSAGVENVIRKQETEKLVMIMDKLNCSIHFGMNSQLEKYGNQSRFQPQSMKQSSTGQWFGFHFLKCESEAQLHVHSVSYA